MDLLGTNGISTWYSRKRFELRMKWQNKAHKLLIENVVTKKTNKSLKNFDTHTTGPVKEIQ